MLNNGILDPIYQVINMFFPASLLSIPFFEFLINLFFFGWGCWLFTLFFIKPVKHLWEVFKRWWY